MHQLGVAGKQMKLTMNTMGSKHTMHTSQLEGIELLDLTEQNVIKLPAIYTKDEMPVSINHIPTSEDLHKWPHLTSMELPQVNADVGLLIGNNVPDASAPLEVKTGSRGSPYMSRSLLGWIPWGVLRNSPNILVNRADVLAIEEFHDNPDFNDPYIKSVNLDFPEKTISDKCEYSQDDCLFLDRIQESQIIVDNHYEYQLPFRDALPSLPKNQYVAKQHLVTLEKMLFQNPGVYEDYQNFMNTLLVNDHAEDVAEYDLGNYGKIWYFPHNSVYNPNVSNKARVVFDGSSKYCGVSLNDKLLQGPDQTNSRVGMFLDGACNPVDISSQGLHIGDTKKTDILINGPQFLRERDMKWPEYPEFSVVIPHDVHETNKVVFATTVEQTHVLDEMPTRFSDWMKLKHTRGLVLYFNECLMSRISIAGPSLKSVKLMSSTNATLPIDLLRAAKTLLIKPVQHQYFSDELTCLADVKPQRKYLSVKSSSHLYKLDSFLKVDLMRVGGRLIDTG